MKQIERIAKLLGARIVGRVPDVGPGVFGGWRLAKIYDDRFAQTAGGFSMTKSITHIPFPGNSGDTPTGAMQFQDDWLGLFVRGDDAIVLMISIQHLSERLADHPDVVVAGSLAPLWRIAEIIARDVMVKGGQHSKDTQQ